MLMQSSPLSNVLPKMYALVASGAVAGSTDEYDVVRSTPSPLWMPFELPEGHEFALIFAIVMLLDRAMYSMCIAGSVKRSPEMNTPLTPVMLTRSARAVST